MLGIVRCDHDDKLFVNHVILVAKQYLYYCRQKSFLPSIRVLDSKIKMIYQLQTIIAKSNNIMSAHNIYKMGQIQSTIMCFGTTAVRIREKKLFTM